MRTEPSAGHVSVAIGWALLAGTLSQNLPAADFSVVLFGLVFVEISSSFLTIGLGSRPTSLSWEDAVGRFLLRWVIFVAGFLFLNQIQVIAIFEHYAYALICVFALCLALALIKLVCAFRVVNQRFGNLLLHARHALVAAAVFGFANLGPLDADMLMSLAVGLLLIVLICVSIGAKLVATLKQETATTAAQFEQSLSAGTIFLFRNIDIVLMASALSGSHILIYLIARGVTGITPLALNLVSDRVFGVLDKAHQSGVQQKFVALAARTNLGFLLIGGSSSLFVLGLGTYVPTFFNIEIHTFRNVFLWLVAAGAAPALFGATGMLLQISERERELTFMSLVGILAVCTSLVVVDISHPEQLAQIFASVQIFFATASAALLGVKCGIWPGVTALLFGKIRLL